MSDSLRLTPIYPKILCAISICVDSGNSGGTDYAPPCDCYQVTFENECSNAASSGNCCGDCRDCEPGGTSGTAECSSDCTNWCANQGTTAGSEQTCQENNGTIRGGYQWNSEVT